MINAILMWICSAISDVFGFIFLYIVLPVIAIAIFRMIWPYIADVVKFFILMIPVAIIFVLYLSGELLSCIVPILGVIAVVVVLLLLFRFFDRKFGILMDRDEAERKGLL
jgi:hypothetical protein